MFRSIIHVLFTGLIGTSCILSPASLLAQKPSLSPTELVDILKKYHPISLQANLRVEQARAAVTSARGGFDPVLENETAQKSVDGRMYYYYNRPELRIPTWYGITLRAGQEFLAGNELLPGDTRGESSYAGVSFSLAKNLLMDRRRATLRTAQVLRDASDIERRVALNQVIREALQTYWDWVRSIRQEEAVRKTWEASLQRLELVKRTVEKGDRASIDSVEARAQAQQLEAMLLRAQVQVQIQLRELSNYFWTANSEPVEIPAGLEPDALSRTLEAGKLPADDISRAITEIATSNPTLQLFPYRLQRLNIERKLQFQELLPDVQFQYNQLGKGYSLAKTLNQPFFENNFRYGFKFSVPLRLSQGRGNYQQARLQVRITELEQDYKQRSIQNDARNLFNEWNVMGQQVELQQGATNGFEQLLRTELLRFNNGESSLFLVNTREVRWLEATLQLIDIKARRCLKQLELDFQLGRLL